MHLDIILLVFLSDSRFITLYHIVCYVTIVTYLSSIFKNKKKEKSIKIKIKIKSRKQIKIKENQNKILEFKYTMTIRMECNLYWKRVESI